MIQNDYNHKESGFSILEMMIAMTILAIGLLGIAALQITAIQGSAYSMKYNQATAYISDTFEDLKNTPFNSLQSKVGAKPIGEYTVTTAVSEGPSGTRNILISAAWKDKNKNHQVSYQTIIAPPVTSANP